MEYNYISVKQKSDNSDASMPLASFLWISCQNCGTYLSSIRFHHSSLSFNIILQATSC